MDSSFNPYQLKNNDGEIQLIWRGSKISDILVRVFHKQLKTETEYITNEQGKVKIKIDVPGEYLINAVHMTEGAFKRGELWTSYWASLTFQIP